MSRLTRVALVLASLALVTACANPAAPHDCVGGGSTQGTGTCH